MACMSRRARSVSLTRYRMVAPEHFQSFTRRTHTTLLCVFDALPDSLERIGLCGNVDRKSTRLNSSHGYISYAVFCLQNKTAHYALVHKHHVNPNEPRRPQADYLPHLVPSHDAH